MRYSGGTLAVLLRYSCGTLEVLCKSLAGGIAIYTQKLSLEVWALRVAIGGHPLFEHPAYGKAACSKQDLEPRLVFFGVGLTRSP